MRHYRAASGAGGDVSKQPDRVLRGAAERAATAARVELGVLPELLGYTLRRAQLSVYQDFFRAVGRLKLRPAEFAVLTVIERNPGLKQSDIAAALSIKRTNFVVLAHELERRALVERRTSARDRRSNALYITEDGKATLRQARALIEAHEQRFRATVGEQGFVQLLSLLHKLADVESG
jgi:DNA-binding MarR family transcriptional regulator